jgi:hypothetical protein
VKIFKDGWGSELLQVALVFIYSNVIKRKGGCSGEPL